MSLHILQDANQATYTTVDGREEGREEGRGEGGRKERSEGWREGNAIIG